MTARWDEPTPTGHVYRTPTNYEELCARHDDAAQAFIEGWDEAEQPPEPTWEMVGLAHEEIRELRQLICDLQIETMHPSMNGEHQCRVRANARRLTVEQWAVIAKAERNEND